MRPKKHGFCKTRLDNTRRPKARKPASERVSWTSKDFLRLTNGSGGGDRTIAGNGLHKTFSFFYLKKLYPKLYPNNFGRRGIFQHVFSPFDALLSENATWKKIGFSKAEVEPKVPTILYHRKENPKTTTDLHRVFPPPYIDYGAASTLRGFRSPFRRFRPCCIGRLAPNETSMVAWRGSAVRAYGERAGSFEKRVAAA
ncbi:MAG: hypothetical protein WA705_16870 [Candidatus Ozemobacteraceae bacterium]